MEENHSRRWKVPFPTNVTFALRCLNLLHLSSPQLVSVSFLSVAHCGISPYVISIIPKKGREEEVTGKKKNYQEETQGGLGEAPLLCVLTCTGLLTPE